MPVVPFMPLIAQGVGMLGGAIAGKKATSAAQQRSPEEAAALTGATGAANTLGNTGSSLITSGQNNVNPAAGYFKTLLNGNRAAMANATAAPRAQIGETMRGAQAGLAGSGIRGAAKDVLSGNLARQGAGAVAGLTTGVQPAAATSLATIGGQQTAQGAPMLGQSGNIFANLLGQGADNRKYARGEGEKTGTAIGSLAASAGNLFKPKTGLANPGPRGLMGMPMPGGGTSSPDYSDQYYPGSGG